MDGGPAGAEETQGLGVLSPQKEPDCQPTQSQSADTDGRAEGARETKETAPPSHREGTRDAPTSVPSLLRAASRFHFATAARVLSITLEAGAAGAKSQQAEAESPSVVPLAHAGNSVSDPARYCVEGERQQRIAHLRQHCLMDCPWTFAVCSVPQHREVVVPQEPFPRAREALETVVELL